MSSDGLYSRQQSLHLLRYECVIVVGCGGIGNWVALDMALSGRVNKLILIDPDTVEESNLNRTYYDYSDIGCLKVNSICNHIIRRRPQQNILKYAGFMNDALADTIIEKVIKDNSYYHPEVCIVDCRDDVYIDCYKINCKLYKVGYDGMSITIDGNPRLTEVFGQRGGTYTVTPSYIGSAQLAAILVCNDVLYPRACYMVDHMQLTHENVSDMEDISQNEEYPYINSRPNNEHDDMGRLNEVVTLDCHDIIHQFIKEKHDYTPPINGY